MAAKGEMTKRVEGGEEKGKRGGMWCTLLSQAEATGHRDVPLTPTSTLARHSQE